jgi:prevent-host-death family protein
MKYVSIYELRNNLAEIVNLVASGNTSVVVTRHDKPVMVIREYKELPEENPLLRSYGMIKDDGISGKTYVNTVRRNKKEKEYVEKLRRNV